MKIVFMGTPEFAASVLRELVERSYEVAAVYTRPDAPAGRGQMSGISPVKRLSEKHRLKTVQPKSLRTSEIQKELQALAPDIIIVAAYGLILPQLVLDMPRLGCLNVHASLLPRHRGAAPVAAAIIAGDSFTGISLMLMDSGIDTGAVYSRHAVPIFDYDTTGSLIKRLALVGGQALLDLLPRIERGTIRAMPQPAGEDSYAPMLDKTAGHIDWRQSAPVIWRLVRALQPWPGAFSTWEGRNLKLLQTIPLDIHTAAKPGTVVELPPGKAAEVGVATGSGVLGLIKLQLEGKRPVNASDFRRGQRSFTGSILS